VISIKKDGREVAAMVLNESVNGVRGIVQCMIKGCEAHFVVMEDDDLGCMGAIEEFTMGHDCDPKRFAGRFKLNRKVRV
jgi:hypothetical protein